MLFSTESPLANHGQSLFQVSASRLRSRPGKWVQKGEASLREEASPEKTGAAGTAPSLTLAMFARPGGPWVTGGHRTLGLKSSSERQ